MVKSPNANIRICDAVFAALQVKDVAAADLDEDVSPEDLMLSYVSGDKSKVGTRKLDPVPTEGSRLSVKLTFFVGLVKQGSHRARACHALVQIPLGDISQLLGHIAQQLQAGGTVCDDRTAGISVLPSV